MKTYAPMLNDFDFPASFKTWFEGQQLVMHRFAAQLGTNRVSLRHWLNGTGFPRNDFCEKLYGLTQLDCFSPEHRDEARTEFEARIPAEVRKARKEKYDANPELYRERALASHHKRYEAQREFVDSLEEREALLKDPRKDKNTCRICWQKNLKDIGPHLGQRHGISADLYKENFGFLRSRNATRSPETQEKQRAAMKKGKHRPPAWTRELLPLAQVASLRTNEPGSARLEKLLNLRGKVLGERPQFWKQTSDGDVVTDARIAQLRLRGMSLEKIAARVVMTLTPVFFRLKRMAFPRKARLFQYGEPITGKSFAALLYDFNRSLEEVAERVGISLDWAQRLMGGRGREWLSHSVARRVIDTRKELLHLFRGKPTTGHKGVGRPRRLPVADEQRMLARYDRLQGDLKVLRAWIRGQDRAPTITAIWDWLCRSWRRGQLRGLQFSPDFFRWVEDNYLDPTFRNGEWVPHDVAREFTAYEFDVAEGFLGYLLTHGAEPIAPE